MRVCVQALAHLRSQIDGASCTPSTLGTPEPPASSRLSWAQLTAGTGGLSSSVDSVLDEGDLQVLEGLLNETRRVLSTRSFDEALRAAAMHTSRTVASGAAAQAFPLGEGTGRLHLRRIFTHRLGVTTTTKTDKRLRVASSCPLQILFVLRFFAAGNGVEGSAPQVRTIQASAAVSAAAGALLEQPGDVIMSMGGLREVVGLCEGTYAGQTA